MVIKSTRLGIQRVKLTRVLPLAADSLGGSSSLEH